jgi:cytochrome c biogenesis protein
MYAGYSAGSRVDPGELPPFSFTLDSLTVTFEKQSAGAIGAARAFDAAVTLRESPDAAPVTRRVRVNHPLQVGSAKVYLVGNGYAPVVTVRDATGAVAFRGPVPAPTSDAQYTSSVVIKVPDARPRQLGLVGSFLPTALLQPGEGWVSIFPDALNPRLVLTAFAARPGEDGLGVDSGVPQSVYVLDVNRLTQLRTADGQPARLFLAPGQSAQLPQGAGSITFDGIKRYAGLDIHSDPSRGWALGTSLLALAGVTTSLFVRRRRLWIRVCDVSSDDVSSDGVSSDGVSTDEVSTDGVSTDDGPGQGRRERVVVEVAGLARGEDAGLALEVKAVLEGAAGRKG